MANKNKSANNRTIYINRGGNKIPVEKLEDRFTILPVTDNQLRKAKKICSINPEKVSADVYKVYTTKAKRDKEMERIRGDECNAIVHHAYKPVKSEGTIYYLTDKIIISFHPGTIPKQIIPVFQKFNLKKIRKYKFLDNTFLVQVTRESGRNPVWIADKLDKVKIIKSAEVNLVNRFTKAFIPKDPLFTKQWHLNARKGRQIVEHADVNAIEAWDITRGDRNVVVAIIDDGFDLRHPDFTGRGKIFSPRDYVDGDNSPFPEAENDDSHGTACAGIAIAESNGRGIIGIAPGCSFMPVRIPFNADDQLLIEIFSETALKADVISCSWSTDPVKSSLSSSVSSLFTKITANGGRRKKGCVICFAAGNYNAPLNDPRNKKFRWKKDDKIRITKGPILNGYAAHPGVIAVSSSTSLNRKATYSNWGKEISVCAPSSNFNPISEHQVFGRKGTWTTDNESRGLGFTSGSRYTGKFGGTSSATPLVAGIAALMLSVNPQLSAARVKKILQETADKIIDPDADLILGTRKGFYKNGHSEWFGFGKVNAAAAVRKARALRK